MQPRRPEILDRVSLSPEKARQALDDLGRVNRWSFGFRAAVRTLVPRLEDQGPSRIVDLGTGSGELLAVLKRAAAKKGLGVWAIALDRKLDHLVYGRRQGYVAVAVAADVSLLPFRDSSLDWALSTLLLHHFEPPVAKKLLAEMVRVGRRGGIVTDLRQGLLTSLAARCLLPLVRVGHIAADDGRASADQAWTLDEVAELAQDHEILELRRRFPRRFSLVLRAR